MLAMAPSKLFWRAACCMTCCPGQELEDTFYVVDLGMLHRLHAFFVAAMPRVTPFYAMKCMPEKVTIA